MRSSGLSCVWAANAAFKMTLDFCSMFLAVFRVTHNHTTELYKMLASWAD